MADLARRVDKLERALLPDAAVPKLVRLCVTDEDEAEAIREAKRLGFCTHPGSSHLLRIRLVPLS